MKDKTWLMVTTVMGLALIISLGYSLKLRRKINEQSDIVVSRSIVQITASNVSIKNVLKAKGKVQKINNSQDKETKEEYNIVITLDENNIRKVKVGQFIEIKTKNGEELLKYKGKITKINQEEKQKNAIVEFNFDDKIKENQEAQCLIVIEEAKDVIAVPIAAIKTRKLEESKQNEENNTNDINQINTTNDTNPINTIDNTPKEEKYVIVVNDDGSTSEIVVKTGISDEYYVEIVSGLSEGQKVQIEEE